MRQPYAQTLCESTVHQGPPQGYIQGIPQRGAAAGGRRRPVEEDPGAKCFRIGLAHRAGAYPAAAPGAICCHIVPDVATYPSPPTPSDPPDCFFLCILFLFYHPPFNHRSGVLVLLEFVL